jgi:hypothetical protein
MSRDEARTVSIEAILVVVGADPANPQCPRCSSSIEWSEAPSFPGDPAVGVSLRCRRAGCVLADWLWADWFVADALRIGIDEARRRLWRAAEGAGHRRGEASSAEEARRAVAAFLA